MKILTLNTWQERGPWKERWEITLQGLEKFQPEIACFQELFNPDWAREVQKRARFPTLLFPKEICGLAVFSHYSARSWGAVELPQSSLEEYSRFVLWAELVAGKSSIFLFNTHLSWQLEDGATREKQVEAILRIMNEEVRGQEVILTGDLNAPPDSPEIRQLIREGKFRDLFVEKHPGEAGFSWNHRNPYVAGAEHKLPDRRIDFILTKGEGPLLKDLHSCDLVFAEPASQGVWASDHFGVLAEFQ